MYMISKYYSPMTSQWVSIVINDIEIIYEHEYLIYTQNSNTNN